MTIWNVAVRSALTAALLAGSAASAATIVATAQFEGSVDTVDGFPSSFVGTDLEFEISGPTGATGTSGVAIPVLPGGLTATGGMTTAFSGNSLNVLLPQPSLGFSAVGNATFYVGDNVSVAGSQVDLLYASGGFEPSANNGFFGIIEYAAIFAPDVLSTPTLQQALGNGLAQSTFIEQVAVVTTTQNINGTPDMRSFLGEISVTNVIFDTIPDPDDGGPTDDDDPIDVGDGGGGNGGSGGGGTTNPAPIPLPASAPLLLAGIGGFMWLRRRR
ncbi:MAG: VPLPA-CTERM sorting domain-containing protein [Pseudomonadota bacterium]